MKICLNGEDIEVACDTLLALWQIEQEARELTSSRGFAIAHNGAVVRKDQWAHTRIQSGDKIDIVRAMSGG